MLRETCSKADISIFRNAMGQEVVATIWSKAVWCRMTQKKDLDAEENPFFSPSGSIPTYSRGDL